MTEELIFDLFRQKKCKAGQIVMIRDVIGLMQNLDPKEQEELQDALQRLESQGYFTYESDGLECLRLTPKGYDYIYKSSSMLESELEELLFDLFRQKKCNAGQIVMIREVIGLMQNLNPKEQEELQDVLQRLESQGYFTYESDGLECLRLTQKGYERIY